MKDYFITMSLYNRWANSQLYKACGELPSNEYLKARKAFFGSIHGTLNHLLAGDRIWLGRFKHVDSGITALDKILYSDFASLLDARKKEDENIIEFVDQLDSKKITDNFSFKTLAGKERSLPLMWLLSHLFNHQTHHRGQVHNMLSQADISPPSIDLYYFLIE